MKQSISLMVARQTLVNAILLFVAAPGLFADEQPSRLPPVTTADPGPTATFSYVIGDEPSKMFWPLRTTPTSKLNVSETFESISDDVGTDPPEPEEEPLPPLEEELWNHGGSYMYSPEGDRLGWPSPEKDAHFDLLRLPEDHVDPQPLTLFADFLGADPVQQRPKTWFGPDGYQWDPQFVLYGGYEFGGIAYQEAGQRRDGLSHQLLLDLDLRLTGTERFHMQFRPLGRGGTGGSFYQFSEPDGYIDNSTAVPQNFWFEGELHSMFSSYLDPFAVRDINITAGKFPYAVHNQLLINDEILGLIVSKNTLYVGSLSNVNVQAIYTPSDVENVADDNCRMYGFHTTLDHQRDFYEASYFFVETPDAPGRDQHFLAFSRTEFRGQLTWAGRTLFKFGDEAGTGYGHLFVLESNYTRVFDHQPLGIQTAVAYSNLFYAGEGWNSAAQGGFNRLRSTFEVNPLVAVSLGRTTAENYGASLGVQLFRHHEDESFSPEIAFQTPGGDFVYGGGLRYQRKTGQRSFFEVLGVVNFSDNPNLRRDGVFVCETIRF